MAKNEVKKVGSNSGAKAVAAPKEKKVRPEFDLSTGVNANGQSVFQDGKLTEPPANYVFGKFQPLKKDAFTSTASFILFSCMRTEASAQRLLARAQQRRAEAERMLKFGGESDVLKKAKKLEKMRAAFAKLQAELEADGVDLESLS